MSSAPAEPSGLELGNVGRCNVFEQPGRAISSALAKPSEFEPARLGELGELGLLTHAAHAPKLMNSFMAI